MRDNALRLLKLVNDLLDVIRLEEGGNDLQMTPVELNSLVARLADDMSFLADTKDVTLERNLHGEPLVVGGDLRALEKILINLLSNSVKFTNKDGQISVGTSVDSGKPRSQSRILELGSPRAISRMFSIGFGKRTVRVLDGFEEQG